MSTATLAEGTLRLGATLLGLLLLTFVIFSHEGQEKVVKAWFETTVATVWIKLDDANRTVSNLIRSLTLRALIALDLAANAAYGERLLSPRAALTSVCYSVGFCSIYLSSTSDLRLSTMLPLGILLFVSPSLKNRTAAAAAGVALIGIFFIFPFSSFVAENTRNRSEYFAHNFVVFAAGSIATFLLDFLAIALIRRTFRLSQHRSSLFGMLGSALLPMAVAPIMIAMLTVGLSAVHLALMPTSPVFWGADVAPMPVPILLFSLFLLLMSTAFIVTILLGGLGATVAFLLPVGLYSILKLKVYESRKAMGAIGIALLALGTPALASAIKGLLPMFGV